MLVSRWLPSAVAARGKIYVFGSTRRREGYFAEAFHFHTDGGSWECVDPEFGLWSQASCIISFGAYHLVHKKWFPVKWLSDPRLIDAPFSHLFHLGNGRLCLFSHFRGMDHLEYLTFRVHLDSASGEVHAIAEPESITILPFPHFACQVLEL
ncbi:hypothetical protein V6N13_013587 [Hibiscus sabdariffa]